MEWRKDKTVLLSAKSKLANWAEIMRPVWEAQKRCKSKVANPVIQERQRRRR